MPLSILVPTVNMDVVVVVDPYMAIIQVQVGKNLVEDVLLDGGLGVNITTNILRKNWDFLYLNLLPTISTWPSYDG
jgi:hypothetical protein